MLIPGKTPSEVAQERLDASNAAVVDIKARIEGERAVRDQVVILVSSYGFNSLAVTVARKDQPETLRRLVAVLPHAGGDPALMAAKLRQLADEIDAAIVRLTEEPNAQGK